MREANSAEVFEIRKRNAENVNRFSCPREISFSGRDLLLPLHLLSALVLCNFFSEMLAG